MSHLFNLARLVRRATSVILLSDAKYLKIKEARILELDALQVSYAIRLGQVWITLCIGRCIQLQHSTSRHFNISLFQYHFNVDVGLVRIAEVELLGLCDADDQADDADHVDQRVGHLGDVLRSSLTRKSKSFFQSLVVSSLDVTLQLLTLSLQNSSALSIDGWITIHITMSYELSPSRFFSCKNLFFLPHSCQQGTAGLPPHPG